MRVLRRDDGRVRNRPSLGSPMRDLPRIVRAGAIGAVLGGVLPDIDHLVPGMGRETHLAFCVLALLCAGIYIAFGGGRVATRILNGRSTEAL
jgi:hypothetical protein